MKKLLGIVLTLAMAIGLLTIAAIPASAAMECFACEGVCFYKCTRCNGFGRYYYCPNHPGSYWDSPMSCSFCGDGVPLLLQSPCDNGCLWNDDFDCYVTPCTICNGLGVVLTRPGPPQNLVLTPGDKKVTMTWEAPDSDGGSPITGYKIQRGIEGTGADVVKVDLGPDVFTYTWTDLQNGENYRFYVWAVNEVGEGSSVNDGIDLDGPRPQPDDATPWWVWLLIAVGGLGVLIPLPLMAIVPLIVGLVLLLL